MFSELPRVHFNTYQIFQSWVWELFSKPAYHHVRGERPSSISPAQPLSGPSPRAWGTRVLLANPRRRTRSIPTCVGNAREITVPGFMRTVHPHVRGEREGDYRPRVYAYGPSPRAWGTPEGPPREAPGGRSIPTCVGNASRRYWREAVKTVHPHVRGERIQAASDALDLAGPSPRAWGTRR